jgi:DNA adenine methylase
MGKLMSRSIAFGWYGGKYSHLDWLLPLLPKSTHFCEPFGGSAAIMINREPSPVETYNDIDEELVNFFQVLRDDQNELIRAIALTPFSRREFELAISEPPQAISRLERARRFYVRARQVRTGLAQTASSGRWAHCKLTSRAGMAGAISRWLGSIDDLSSIVQRLQRVQIESGSAIDIIKRYDSEETLFYCDPPYPHDSRGDRKAYAYEMTDDDHRKLASVLHGVSGKVAISGYDCTLMNELYGDWKRIAAPEKYCHSIKQLRTEILWVNYIPDDRTSIVAKTKLKKSEKVVMQTPVDILDTAFKRATVSIQRGESLMISPEVVEKIEYVCRLWNKSGIRFILASTLAKIDDPKLDIRKPFSQQLKENDAYSGRKYDEKFVAVFLNRHDLQAVCNPTTAFLTPAYRTKGIALSMDAEIVGKPQKLYRTLLELLDYVYIGQVPPEDLLTETIKWLLIIRDERRQRIQSLLANLSVLDDEDIPLSADAIVKLIRQHLDSPRSSRLGCDFWMNIKNWY